MNRWKTFIAAIILPVCALSAVPASQTRAQTANMDVYTVKPGDSLWKIAVKYQVGLSEIIAANPQFSNPHLIYPGEKVNVPLYNDVKAIEMAVVALVNQERTKRGLRALANNWELERVARIKSQDMRDRHYFSHTSPTYGDPFTMIRSFGISFTAAGENIAAGQSTAAQVMQSWMNSSGHRQNILNPNFTQIGVGYASGGSYRFYWTQEFVRP